MCKEGDKKMFKAKGGNSSGGQTKEKKDNEGSQRTQGPAVRRVR